MASGTPIFHLLTRSRERSFFLPREHGAWGMLLVPLVTGAAAGHPHGERIFWVFLYAATALGLFCLRAPLEAGLGISPLRPQTAWERRLVYYSIYVYASVASLALILLMLLAHAYGLLVLGAVAATALLLQIALRRLGRETRLISQWAGAVALSSTAAAAYYLATGHFGPAALMIWLANWLFAANQIHFVQLRIHSARAMMFAEKLLQGRGFLLHQAGALLLLVWFWISGWLPGLAVLAFGPLFVRGFAWFLESPRPLRIHRLGVNELSYAIVFGLLFIAGFHHLMG